MTDHEQRLNGLLSAYRDACPAPEPSAGFMPAVWQRIEARRGVAYSFQRLSRMILAASGAMCLLLAGLNYLPAHSWTTPNPTYTDALVADQVPEETYYSEILMPSAPVEGSQR